MNETKNVVIDQEFITKFCNELDKLGVECYFSMYGDLRIGLPCVGIEGGHYYINKQNINKKHLELELVEIKESLLKIDEARKQIEEDEGEYWDSQLDNYF